MLTISLRPTGRKEKNTREGKSVTSTEGSAKQARKVTTPLVTAV